MLLFWWIHPSRNPFQPWTCTLNSLDHTVTFSHLKTSVSPFPELDDLHPHTVLEHEYYAFVSYLAKCELNISWILFPKNKHTTFYLKVAHWQLSAYLDKNVVNSLKIIKKSTVWAAVGKGGCLIRGYQQWSLSPLVLLQWTVYLAKEWSAFTTQ